MIPEAIFVIVGREPTLFEAKPLGERGSAGREAELEILIEAVLSAFARGGVLAIPIEFDEAIAGAEFEFLIEAEVHRGPKEEILPVEEGMVAAELSFEMEGPAGAADGVVAEVLEPDVPVRVDLSHQGEGGRKQQQ